jgi:regulation of enolase protein 1 (concanavalin A-like superfamily)
MRLPPLPGELCWTVEPVSWAVRDDGLTVTAGPRTDLFADPGGRPVLANAPRLLGRAEGDFLFGARVRVEFGATFDAGVLLLWLDDGHWAKLCFEYSPQPQPTIVSVVTRTASDDANSFSVDGDQVWLRIARVGSAFAFHASTDGALWQLIRHFGLGAAASPEIGFLVQSPTGEGCTVSFEDVFFRSERLPDLRSGV